ncbi:MAG: hypothetical protein HRU09_05835 [Oligoflexales bacterium]|nr:hypothetical protein [Oligoflexales bacterium]
MLSLLCFIGLVLGFAHEAMGIEQEWLLDSPRVWGRGRTFVAAPDSDEAARFNPATLAEPDVSFQMRLLQLDGMIGENTIDTIGDLVSAAGTSDAIDLLSKFDSKFGERQSFKAQGSLFSLRFGSFEISPFGLNNSWLELTNPSIPNMEWKADTLAGVSISYGFELFPSFFMGLALRPMYRWHIAGNIAFVDIIEFVGPSEIDFETFTPLTSGAYVAGDVGMVWNLSPTFRWGLTFRNVGDATVTNEFEDAPPPLRQNISTGIFSRSPGQYFNLDYYLDIHSLTNRDGLNLLRLVNTGAELGSSVFSRDHDFGLLAGLNEGYFCTGLFADLLFMRFDLVNYGVELGHAPGQKPDRRWGISARTSMTF